MNVAPIATGKVESLAVNGEPVGQLYFFLDGPEGDVHRGSSRRLNGHDGDYLRTSSLSKGSPVLNWRTWTGLSVEEVTQIESQISLLIPPGCLLENLRISGIPNFSSLAPTTRLVFPQKSNSEQAILAVWEENGPCRTVGNRLEQHHRMPGVKTAFIAAAQHKRGVMGLVLAAGLIEVGDVVLVYPPVQ